MGTYFFYEDTSDVDDGAMSIVRYYYDDISEDILTRSFRFPPKAVRKRVSRQPSDSVGGP